MSAFLEYFPNEGDLERYIREIADLMGLRDWTITLEDESPGGDALGHIHCLYGRRVASIRLAEHDTIEDLRQTIAHELLHAHYDAARLPIENIRNTIGQPLYDATHSAFVDAIEYATDAIASAWSAMLPLPSKTKAKAA